MQATIGSTICVSGWTAKVRPPSSCSSALRPDIVKSAGHFQ